MFAALAAAAVASLATTAPVAPGEPALSEDPAPLVMVLPADETPVAVDIVVVNGSGCPQGTAVARVDPYDDELTVTLSEFLARTGPAISIAESRRNCLVNMNVRHPEGFTYSLDQVDVEGEATLLGDARMTQYVEYNFQNVAYAGTSPLRLEAPWSGHWATTNVAVEQGRFWEPCAWDHNMNLNTIVIMGRQEDPQAVSSVRVTKISGLRLKWDDC